MIKKIVILSLIAFVQIKSAQNFFSIQFMCYADKAKRIKYNLENIGIEVVALKDNESYDLILTKDIFPSNINEFGVIELFGRTPYEQKCNINFYIKFDKELMLKNLNLHLFNFKNICFYDNSDNLIAKFKIQMGKKHTIFLDKFESEIKVLSVDYN